MSKSRGKRKASEAPDVEKKQKTDEKAIVYVSKEEEADYEIHHQDTIYHVNKSSLRECALLKDGDITGLDKATHFDVPKDYSPVAVRDFLVALNNPFGSRILTQLDGMSACNTARLAKVALFFGHKGFSDHLAEYVCKWTYKSVGEFYGDGSYHAGIFGVAELAAIWAPPSPTSALSNVYIHLVKMICEWVCTGRQLDYRKSVDVKQPRCLLQDIFKDSPRLMLDVLLMSTLDYQNATDDKREAWFLQAYAAKEKHPRPAA